MSCGLARGPAFPSLPGARLGEESGKRGTAKRKFTEQHALGTGAVSLEKVRWGGGLPVTTGGLCRERVSCPLLSLLLLMVRNLRVSYN